MQASNQQAQIANQRNFSDKAIGILKSQSSTDDLAKASKMAKQQNSIRNLENFMPFAIRDREGHY